MAFHDPTTFPAFSFCWSSRKGLAQARKSLGVARQARQSAVNWAALQEHSDHWYLEWKTPVPKQAAWAWASRIFGDNKPQIVPHEHGYDAAKVAARLLSASGGPHQKGDGAKGLEEGAICPAEPGQAAKVLAAGGHAAEGASSHEDLAPQYRCTNPVMKMFDDRELFASFESVVLGDKIGSGTFGIVYRAVWRERDCVAKFLEAKTPIADAVAEVYALSKFRGHPSVVQLLEVAKGQRIEGENHPRGRFCFIFEAMDGDLLRLLEQQPGGFAPQQIRSLFLQLCTGLSSLHGGGLLHGDFKPANILTKAERDGFIVKLADFGSCVQAFRPAWHGGGGDGARLPQ